MKKNLKGKQNQKNVKTKKLNETIDIDKITIKDHDLLKTIVGATDCNAHVDR